MKRIRISVKDNGEKSEIYKMYSILDKGADVIYHMLPKYVILVHCHAGRQRSASIILAFLMKYCVFTLQESIDTLQSKRSNIVGINFSQALSQYQIDLWKEK